MQQALGPAHTLPMLLEQYMFQLPKVWCHFKLSFEAQLCIVLMMLLYGEIQWLTHCISVSAALAVWMFGPWMRMIVICPAVFALTLQL